MKISDIKKKHSVKDQHFFAVRIDTSLYEAVNARRKKTNLSWVELIEYFFKLFLEAKL